MGYIVNKFKQVRGDGAAARAGVRGSHVGGKGIKAGVVVTSGPLPVGETDIMTDTFENITFPHSVMGGNDALHLKSVQR